MSTTTPQIEHWSGNFGREYVDRSTFGPAELDRVYAERYGISRTELNARFLDGIDRKARILEIGANVGNQLRCLQAMGFENLYGVELNSYAVENARALSPQISFLQGSAFDIPFKDRWFDVVFTSGVLIHISPADLPKALAEIRRCTSRYIWGYESYAPELTDVLYRGNENVMWKGDYQKVYANEFPDLALLKRELVPYLGTDMHDIMFLYELPPSPSA